MERDSDFCGAGHFALHGKIDGNFYNIVKGPIHGTAIIDGQSLVMSLTSTASNMEPVYGIGSSNALHIVISMTTLTGRFTLMTSSFTPVASGALVQSSVGGGGANIVSCQ